MIDSDGYDSLEGLSRQICQSNAITASREANNLGTVEKHVNSNKQYLYSVLIRWERFRRCSVNGLPTVEVLGNLSSAKALPNPSVAEMFILMRTQRGKSSKVMVLKYVRA